MLVFKEPLTSNRITGALRYLTPPKHDVLYRPDRDVARHKISQPFYAFAQAVKQGRKKTFVDAYPFDISAVTDDSPFFFQYAKIKKVASLFRSKTVDFDELVHGNWSWFILLCVMIQSTVFAIVVALLPYRRMRRSGAGHRQLVATSLLFAALGFGYVCLQMGLIQKLVLYLTHPVYSIAVVVPALLLFGGMGALFSLRIRSRHLVLASTLAIVVAIVAVNITLDSLLSWLQPEKLWLRCAVVVLLLSPIGLLLGVPFANAMRGLSTQKKALVPWAFGLNGALSVLGSAGAVVLAIGGGFTFVIWIAAAVYGLAAVGAALESSHGRC